MAVKSGDIFAANEQAQAVIKSGMFSKEELAIFNKKIYKVLQEYKVTLNCL